MRTQTRIAFIFFVSTVTAMVVLSTVVYYMTVKYTFADFYKRLETRASLAARIRFENRPVSIEAFRHLRDSILEKLPREVDHFIQLSDETDFKSESDSLGLPVSFFIAASNGESAEYRKGNVFFKGIRFSNGGQNYLVVVSAESYYYSHHTANLRNVLFGAVVIMSILVLTMSLVFSRIVLDPVRQFTRKVKDINSQNLHLRLNMSGRSDDVNELKVTFNTMLDRLEAAFATQNNFISNASHELGTPLTAIIGEADVALSRERSNEQYKEFLKAIAREAERLDEIVKTLLSLAQTGFDGVRQKFEPTRVDELLWEVKLSTERINPKSKVHINLSLMPENPEHLTISGNEKLLRLALINLVGNGVKYSNNQPVHVSIGISDNNLILVVKDNGIGIPDDEIKFIYDPFFRASNTRDFEGYGIGLPLTRNIVRIHKGSIHVESKLNHGTTVTLAFPIGGWFY
jgi:signal transduction histidine kinase